MDKPKKPKNDLILGDMKPKCPICGSDMKKVSWKITAGAFDAGREVEQTTYQCDLDGNFISIEVSTGNDSEFASPRGFVEY